MILIAQSRGILKLLVLLGTLSTLVFSCVMSGRLTSRAEERFNRKLLAAHASNQDTMRLRDLTDFAWTQVCVVDSYYRGSKALAEASGRPFTLSDHWRWFWYALGSEGATAFVFVASDGIVPIKVPRSHEVYLHIRGPRQGAKHSCDHGKDTHLLINQCTEGTHERGSKRYCDVSLY